MIILDIRPEDLAYNAYEYDRLSLLLPYYQTHPETAEIVNLKGPFEKIKLVSAIYPYNSMIFRIVMGNLEYNKKREMDDNGYVPFFHTMQYERIDTLQSAILPADEHKIDALSDIISVCQQKNIDLIFVFSPLWLIIEDNLRDTIITNLCSQKWNDLL